MMFFGSDGEQYDFQAKSQKNLQVYLHRLLLQRSEPKELQQQWPTKTELLF